MCYFEVLNKHWCEFQEVSNHGPSLPLKGKLKTYDIKKINPLRLLIQEILETT